MTGGQSDHDHGDDLYSVAWLAAEAVRSTGVRAAYAVRSARERLAEQLHLQLGLHQRGFDLGPHRTIRVLLQIA